MFFCLARIFDQLLLSRRKLVCGLRYISARDPQRVSNTPLVASLTYLATHQLAPPRNKTGEISGLGLFVVVFVLASTCHAITIRHDVPDSQYTALANNVHPYGGLISGNGFYGSGTLISPTWVLTAAHVLSGNVSFQSSAGSVNIAEKVKHPNWGDIGLGRLASPITSIEPVKLYDLELGIEDRQDAIVLGAGNTGTGQTGQRGSSGGARRAAETYVYANANAWGWSSHHLLTWFRKPSNRAASLEGGSAQGDSGGAVLLDVDGEYAMAGVLTQTWWGGSGGDAIGKYDTGGVFVRSAPVNDWILQHATDATLVAIAPPPPPPTDFQWVNRYGGNWNKATNWSPNGIPNGNDARATFGELNSTKKISLGSTVTVKTMQFDNRFTYRISGGRITLAAAQGTPLIDIVRGSHEISSALSLSQNTTNSIAFGAELEVQSQLHLNGRTLTKTGTGTLSLNSSATSKDGTLRAMEGWIKGNGTLGGKLVNYKATVTPGNDIGVLNIAGPFYQQSTGVLQMEIGGTTAGVEYDRLVAESLQAGGTLEVLLTNNFSPSGGDVFDLLDFSSLTGSFSSVQLPVGIDWDTSNLLIDGTLMVTPTILEWKGVTNSLWSSSTSWTPRGVPNSNSTVLFGNAARAPQTVQIDQSTTIRELQFDNSNTHILVGERLTFDANEGSASLHVTQGEHFLFSPVVLRTNTNMQIAPNSSLSMVGSLNLNGQVFTKMGRGNLNLKASPGNTAGLINALQGTITGDGVLLGDLHNISATVDPGDESRRLVIAGKYSQDTTGTLRLELADIKDYDQMSVNTTELAGTLQLTLANGYRPTVGDEFDVLDVTGTTRGNFENWNFPRAFNWDVSRLLVDGKISVVPSTFTWAIEGPGLWSNSGNWSAANTPTGLAPEVVISGAPAAPAMILVDRDVSVKTLLLNSGDQPYVLVGDKINLQAIGGTAAILSAGAAHQINTAITLHSDAEIMLGTDDSLTLSNLLDLKGHSLTVKGNGTLYLNTPFAPTEGGVLHVTSDATLAGDGFVVGNIWNFSTVAPGTNDVGTIVISENLQQSAASRLKMEIGQSGCDTIVASAASLNGVFELSVLEGFVPPADTTYQLLNFSNISGSFQTLNLQPLPGGLAWVTTDLETLGKVSVTGKLGDFNFDNVLELADVNQLVAAIATGSTDRFYDVTGDWLVDNDDLDYWITDLYGSFPGDVNLDRTVNALDYAMWKNHRFTTSYQWGQGDFDANGKVDIRDFNIWNRHKSLVTGVSVLSVPEPTGVLTALIAGCFSSVMVSLTRRMPTG